MESLGIRFLGKCISNLGFRLSAAGDIRVSGAKDERRTTQQPIRNEQRPTNHHKARENGTAVHVRNCRAELNSRGRHCLKTLVIPGAGNVGQRFDSTP